VMLNVAISRNFQDMKYRPSELDKFIDTISPLILPVLKEEYDIFAATEAEFPTVITQTERDCLRNYYSELELKSARGVCAICGRILNLETLSLEIWPHFGKGGERGSEGEEVIRGEYGG